MLSGFEKGYRLTNAEKDILLSGFEKRYCLTNAEKDGLFSGFEKGYCLTTAELSEYVAAHLLFRITGKFCRGSFLIIRKHETQLFLKWS